MSQATVLRPAADTEMQLERSAFDTVAYAKCLSINGAEAYAEAAEFLREIKTRAKRIAEYWALPKAKAAEAHKEIVARERAMSAPLAEAEGIIKAHMLAYDRAQQAARAAEEAELRRRQREESERFLAKAVKAEENGDELGALAAVAMAESIDGMAAASLSRQETAPTGISTRTTWKARVIDDAAVPVTSGGIMLRPVDTKALNKLAALTRGTASIPGVEFYQDSTIAVR